MLVGVSVRVFSVLALAAFAACNTYNESLLQGSLGSSLPAAGAVGMGGSSGDGSGAAAGEDTSMEGGAAGEVSSGGSPAGGDGQGGSPTSEAGSSGNAPLGGTTGVGGTAGSSGNGTAGSGGAPIVPLIDDFEDLDAFVNRVNGRNGPWYVFSDGTKTGTLGPLSIKEFPTADARPDSAAGLHLTASGFTVWGAGVGADMVNQAGKKVAYDVSAYSGIRFYAKIASGTTTTLKVLLPNVHSDVDGGECNETTARCGDHLFKTVSGLKTTWAAYEVKFADFTQQGFGKPQTTFDPAGVYSVQFTLTNTAAIDIWLDDVSFILK